MDYENYIELYEAVYFFNRINCIIANPMLTLIYNEEIKTIGINESTYKAMLRILVVNHLMDFDGTHYILSDENLDKHQQILNNIIREDPSKRYSQLFDKALNPSQFFFNHISEAEYDIYSRCDFEVTYEIGKIVARHLNLTNRKILELGGNSGGLATVLVQQNTNCFYTIVDTEIPCKVGNAYNRTNQLNLNFIEGDIFALDLETEIVDCVILMNLLHDFDDQQCMQILSNCIKYSDFNTSFLIIEDILTGEFQPKEVVMHGLRLSAECRGGKQRTVDEFIQLFSGFNYKLERKIQLDQVHTMLIMTAL